MSVYKEGTWLVDANRERFDLGLLAKLKDPPFYRKGALGSSDDLDDYRTNADEGLWQIGQDTINSPSDMGSPGWVLILRDTNSGWVIQRAFASSWAVNGEWERKWTGSEWQDWRRIDADTIAALETKADKTYVDAQDQALGDRLTAVEIPQIIPQNADLNTLIDPGKWVRTGGIMDIGNIPIWNANGFSVINYEAGGGRIIQQASAVNSTGIAATWSRARSYTGTWYPWKEHVYKDMLDAVSDDLGGRISRAAIKVDASKIVAVGDSQVAAGYSWAYKLGTRPGLTVTNHSQSGFTPDEVLLQSGTRGIRIPAGVTLQAGVPVEVTPDWEVVNISWVTRTWSGDVDGHPATLRWNHVESRWEIILADGRADHTTTDTSMWWSNRHDTHPEARRIIWFGGNAIRNRLSRDGELPWESAARSYAWAVSVYGDQTIVCGYVPAYADTSGAAAADDLRDWMGRTLPDQFLDVRHQLQENAPAILGRELTAQDEDDIEEGWLPRDLYREDGVHLADQTHVWLAEMFAAYPYGATPELDLTSSYDPVTRGDLPHADVGSPEGVVAGGIGTVYTDTAATAGAIRWIKASGTGVTGWTVEYGDTGWRVWMDANTSPTHITSGRILIRRKNDRVHVTFDETIFANPEVSPGALPVGFRVTGTTLSWPLQAATWPVAGGYVRLLGSNTWMNIYGASTTDPTFTTISFVTDNRWPTTLPGTPA